MILQIPRVKFSIHTTAFAPASDRNL